MPAAMSPIRSPAISRAARPTTMTDATPSSTVQSISWNSVARPSRMKLIGASHSV